MSQAIDDVIAERRRQIEAEGWTAEHDAQHEPGDLCAAGASYAGNAWLTLRTGQSQDDKPVLWPWDAQWWKPKGPRRDLVRAAALILAEIEKIDRAEATKGGAA